MIVVSTVDALIEWLELNRTDIGSTIPYVRPNEIEGGYELPEDTLIIKGLKELEIEYTVVVTVHGTDFQIESKYLE